MLRDSLSSSLPDNAAVSHHVLLGVAGMHTGVCNIDNEHMVHLVHLSGEWAEDTQTMS